RKLWTDDITVSTPVLRTVNASVTLRAGKVPIFAEGAEGRERRVDMSLGYRPSASVRVEGLAALSWITRAFDGTEFARTAIPRLKLEYQPSRSLFFRVVSELRDQRTSALQAAGSSTLLYLNGAPSAATRTRNLRTDWLISYEPAP